jgi:hypothetical protein
LVGYKGYKDVVKKPARKNSKPEVRGPVLPPNFYKFNAAGQAAARK